MLNYSRNTLFSLRYIWKTSNKNFTSGQASLHRPLSRQLWNHLSSLNLQLSTKRGQRGGNHLRFLRKHPGYITTKPIWGSRNSIKTIVTHDRVHRNKFTSLRSPTVVNITCDSFSLSHQNSNTYSTSRSSIPSDKFATNKNNELNFCLLNTQSLKNKSAVISDYLCEKRIDIAAFTETWFTEDDNAVKAECLPNGYKILDQPRVGRNGGGTAIVYRDTIKVDRMESGEMSSFEFSKWLLKIGSANLLLMVIYRPPYSTSHPVSINTFLDEFADFLEDLILCQHSILVSGDFNIHIDNQNATETKLFMDLLDTMGLKQLVHVPTHRFGHTLDLIITREFDPLICTTPIVGSFLSDHCSILCDLQIPKPELGIETKSYRKHKNIDIGKFKLELASTDLILEPPTDLDNLIGCYNSTLLALLDKHAPEKTKTLITRPRVPWFDENIRATKRQKRKAEKRWKRTKFESDWKKYKEIKNKVTYIMNAARQEFYTKFVEENSHDTRKLFFATKKLLNLNKESPLPPHESEVTLANNFGTYFVKKIADIRSQLDDEASNESVEMPESLPTCSSFLNDFTALSGEDVKNLVIGAPTKSCILDPMPTQLVKECIDVLLPVLTTIINTSLLTSNVPVAWKKSILRPLLKKLDSELVFKNYRPVSNLSFLSKLTEKAASGQTYSYLSTSDLYPSMQSAYRPHYSTETALLRLKNDILLNMNKQHVTLLVLLDLTAAFDTVDHRILLQRLNLQFGITGNALAWFSSYLSNRSQQVSIGKVLSNNFNTDFGVPQGSCLGPLLFSLYSSQLFNIIRPHLPTVQCYADDSQLYLAFKPSDDCIDQNAAISSIEACIEDIRKWMKSDKLMLNDSKTEFMVIGTNQQLAKVNIQHICVGSAEIEPSANVRNLGAWFDSNLNMRHHVSKICSSAFYYLHNIRRIRKYLTKSVTETLVHALVSSRIDYCNSLLYGMPTCLLNKLQRVQNAAARLITGQPRFCSITPILFNLHWLPVKYRIQFKVIIIVFKSIHGVAPSYLQDLVKRNSHSRYSLRSNDELLLAKPRFKSFSTMGDRSFCVAAPTLWNALPKQLRDINNLLTFKKHLKTYLFKIAFY